jgi:hypothetical protein
MEKTSTSPSFSSISSTSFLPSSFLSVLFPSQERNDKNPQNVLVEPIVKAPLFNYSFPALIFHTLRLEIIYLLLLLIYCYYYLFIIILLLFLIRYSFYLTSLSHWQASLVWSSACLALSLSHRLDSFSSISYFLCAQCLVRCFFVFIIFVFDVIFFLLFFFICMVFDL